MKRRHLHWPALQPALQSASVRLLLAAFVIGQPASNLRGQAPPFAARDSAAIRIVESARPQLDSARSWRLEARPNLVIGANQNDPSQQFRFILGVATFSSGMIAVANDAPGELRIFSSDGRFVRRVGRTGSGPGEFYRTFDAVNMCARDTLFVLLRSQMVLATADSVLGPRAVTTPDGLQPPGLFACGRGRMLWALPQVSQQARAGFAVSRVPMRIASAGGTWLGAPDPFEIADIYYMPASAAGRLRGPAAPFSRRFSAAFASAGLYVQTDRTAQVLRYNDAGRITMKIRILQPVRRVTNEHGQRALERMAALGLAGDELVDYRRMYADPQAATTLPAFAEMLVDADDYLWVREYDETDIITFRIVPGDRARRWAVFHPDGQLVTWVSTPAGFTPHEIGRDYMLGVSVDVDDVARVHRYAIVK